MDLKNLSGVGVDSVKLRTALAHDPCLGFNYTKTAKECRACLAPVIIAGKLMLMNEACASWSVGATPGTIQRLTSQEVLDRLTAGATPDAIFSEILGSADPIATGDLARQVLVDRLAYLKWKGLTVPKVPHKKELIRVHRQKTY